MEWLCALGILSYTCIPITCLVELALVQETSCRVWEPIDVVPNEELPIWFLRPA